MKPEINSNNDTLESKYQSCTLNAKKEHLSTVKFVIKMLPYVNKLNSY